MLLYLNNRGTNNKKVKNHNKRINYQKCRQWTLMQVRKLSF